MSSQPAQRRLREGGLRLRTAKRRDIGLSLRRVQESRFGWARDENRMWAGLFDRTVYIDECCFCTLDNIRRSVWVRPLRRGRVTHWVRRSGRVSVSIFGGLVGSRLTSLVENATLGSLHVRFGSQAGGTRCELSWGRMRCGNSWCEDPVAYFRKKG